MTDSENNELRNIWFYFHGQNPTKTKYLRVQIHLWTFKTVSNATMYVYAL